MTPAPVRAGLPSLPENTIDLQCRASAKYNASHWNFWQERRNPRAMRINRVAMENTMRNNEARIVLLTSGCKGGANLAAVSA
jgi:hypothetical protein